MQLPKVFSKELHHQFVVFRKSYSVKRPSFRCNEVLFLKDGPGSGKTAVALDYCANHASALYFSFRSLDAALAPRIFSAAHPDVFSRCVTWSDFFEQLQAYYAKKSGAVFFDDAGMRNDKTDFLDQLQRMLEKNTRFRIFVVFLLRPWEALPLRAKELPLQPFSPAAIRRMLCLKDADTFRLYTLTGGNPYLLSLYDTQMSFAENVQSWLRTDSPFYRFAQDWMASCFRAPESYNTLMYGMATGTNRVSELAELSGYPQNKVEKYLKALEAHGLVVREKEQGSYARYVPANNYLLLWFRCLFAATPDMHGVFPEETCSSYLNVLENGLVPRTFRKSVLYWLDHHQWEYLRSNIDVHAPYKRNVTAQDVRFDYVFQTDERESRYIVIKLFDHLEGRCGLKEWHVIEGAAPSVVPFYRTTLVLASINRFSDACWEQSCKLENVKLVQVQTLTETDFNTLWSDSKKQRTGR